MRKINPKNVLLTDPAAVSKHMQYFMQTIYNLQKNLTPEKEHILAFLSAGEDLEVIQELENRKLSNREQNSLEGEITKKELKTNYSIT